MQLHPLLFSAALAATAAPAAAQFSTPGMPSSGGQTSQTTRFDNDYNPAIGLMFDVFAGYHTADDDALDGFDTGLRAGEITVSTWIDPKAWAYGVIVFSDEGVELEEGAVHYVGFEGNETLRIGRFFVDFGKQMQAHQHALRTPDRPAVLREFLGAELGGDGIEFDNWFTVGDDTIVRYSLGAFQGLSVFASEEGPMAVSPDRPELDQLAFTARITGFSSLTDQTTLQLGASLRSIPDYTILDETSGTSATGLDNNVYGFDATWGWTDETNTKTWTAGGEFLVNTGDLSAAVSEPVPGTFALSVLDDTATGFYVFADHAWDRFHSAGVQFSSVETASPGLPTLDETDLYYTYKLSEFQRLRFALTNSDLDGDQDTRFGIQYTAFMGPHSHGVNF
jgi:hypothetical protein